VRKSGSQKTDDRQDLEIRNYYIDSETHLLVLRGSRFEEVNERDDSAIEVYDPEDGNGAIDVIRVIVESNPAMDCRNIKYKQKRIATLIQYPEFKIRWRRVVIKIGCVRISIKVPQLMYRNNKRVLYAGLAYSADVGDIVIDVLEYCLVKSAFAASIAGLATANIGVAGAAFKVPICKVDHIKDALYILQASDIKTVAATEKTEDSIFDIDFNQPIAIIMGSEHRGVNPSVLKMVDYKAKLPLLGEIESLNVSVACGAFLYETVRQRMH